LAPLEMVLALPLLLFIMALIVNIGVVACWKVRGLSVARHAVWGSRWPRTGDTNPRPAYWPAAATMAATGPVNDPAVDDPRVEQLVARGPVIMGTQVNTNLLDPTRGLRTGSATLTRGYPLLPKIGPFHLSAKTCMIDDQWQYNTAVMGMSSNVQRRILVLYTLPIAPASLSIAYRNAILAVLNAPFQPQLQLLNGFYPQLQQFCTTDQATAKQAVQNLIDRIQGKDRPHVAGVAEVMTRTFINLYKQELQTSGNAAQTTLLQTWISQLQQFLLSLQNG
jgi:hypothetical protein